MTNLPEDERFLANVASLAAEGLQMQEIAAKLNLKPPALTYRLLKLGYGGRVQIVDLRTGQRLTEAVKPILETQAAAA